MYWYSRDLCLIGGGGGINLPWIYVHYTISVKFGVAVFKACMLDWSRGWGQSAMGICALCYICQVWCSSMQGIYAQMTARWGQSAMGIHALCYI